MLFWYVMPDKLEQLQHPRVDLLLGIAVVYVDQGWPAPHLSHSVPSLAQLIQGPENNIII